MAEESCHWSAEPWKVEALVEHCIERLRARGLRRSRGLDALLRQMAGRHRPATLAELAQAPELSSLDQATIYRLVIKLEEAGLVRRLGLHERATYFLLVIDGHHHDYLVCTRCGKIEDLDVRCPVEALEEQIMATRGYSSVYHELEFYGVCPACGAQ